MQMYDTPPGPQPPGGARPTPPDLDTILAFAAELEGTASDLEGRLASTLQRVSGMHWSSPAALACRGTAEAAALDLRKGWQTYREASARLREHARLCQAAFDTALAQWQRAQEPMCVPPAFGGVR